MSDGKGKVNKTFLKDVLICSLSAYGGPEAHIAIFTDQLVIKNAYLKEEELIELIALCSVLPGPKLLWQLVIRLEDHG